MPKNQQNTTKDNTAEPIEKIPAKSVVLQVSIDNRPMIHNGKETSIYKRLSQYARDKGLNEQDAIRFAIGVLLEKSGY